MFALATIHSPIVFWSPFEIDSFFYIYIFIFLGLLFPLLFSFLNSVDFSSLTGGLLVQTALLFAIEAHVSQCISVDLTGNKIQYLLPFLAIELSLFCHSSIHNSFLFI